MRRKVLTRRTGVRAARARAKSHFRLHCFLLLVLALVSNTVTANEWIYTFRDGDNLWDLTQRHLTSMRYVTPLQRLNSITNPYQIPPGTDIRVPLAWTLIQATEAEVVRTHGEVSLMRGSPGTPTALRNGMQLAAGDQIFSSEGSFGTLKFRDGSKLRIHPNSKVRIRKMNMYGDRGFFDSGIDLESGRTENRVPPRDGVDSRLEIKTPAAVSSVRGTEFRVGVNDADQSSTTEVLSGGVMVSGAGESVNIPAGFGSYSIPGKPPAQATPLLAAPSLESLESRYEAMPFEVSFGSIAGAVKYRVQIAKDSSFEEIVSDSATPDSPIIISELPDGEYVLRVRAIDKFGIQGRSASRDIAVNARPEAPFPISPAAGTIVLQEKVVLKWTQQPSADEYLLSVSSDPKFETSDLIDRRTADTHFDLEEQLPPGRYYWRLQSNSASEGLGPYGAPLMFEIPQAGPPLGSEAVSESEIALHWRGSEAVEEYRVKVARDSAFKDVLVDERTQVPTLTIPRPAPGSYHIGIESVDKDGAIGTYEPQIMELTEPIVEEETTALWWLLLIPLMILL